MAGKNSARAPEVNDLLGGARAFIRGIPVGGDLMDEGLAAYHATFGGDRGQSWAERWSSNVEQERAYDAAYDAKHPYWSAGLQLAGGAAVPTGLLASKIPAVARGLRWVGGELIAPKSQLARRMAGEAALGAAEGTRLRTGAREQKRVEGILGRIDVDSPLLSLIPLPWQGH